MPTTPGGRLARVLGGSHAPGAFSAQLSVPASDIRFTADDARMADLVNTYESVPISA